MIAGADLAEELETLLAALVDWRVFFFFEAEPLVAIGVHSLSLIFFPLRGFDTVSSVITSTESDRS